MGKVILPDPNFGWWLAGLVDGEGCFYISPTAGCRFIVLMRADDAELLEHIQRELGGMGRIGYQFKNAVAGGRNPTAHLTVAKKRDLAYLVRVFDRYTPMSKKARDYTIWREAVLAHCAGALPRSLEPYRQALIEARKYRGPWEADGDVDGYESPLFDLQQSFEDLA